jgi:hypothetical protein
MLYVRLFIKSDFHCQNANSRFSFLSLEFQHALIRKRELRKREKREHWLDYADDTYDRTLINDTKATLRVLFLYLPLPFFWALFDQQVSMVLQCDCLPTLAPL